MSAKKAERGSAKEARGGRMGGNFRICRKGRENLRGGVGGWGWRYDRTSENT